MFEDGLFIFNGGHSIQKDPGAVSPVRPELNDYIYTDEANYCLKIARLCSEKMIRLGSRSKYIQDNSLENICDFANENEADIFVSIHLNSVDRIDAKGTETFYFESSENSKILAQAIQSKLIEKTDFINRGIKPCRFYVCRYTNMPAVLVECGFVSNPEEERIMNTDEYITRLVDSICYGAINGYNLLRG